MSNPTISCSSKASRDHERNNTTTTITPTQDILQSALASCPCPQPFDLLLSSPCPAASSKPSALRHSAPHAHQPPCHNRTGGTQLNLTLYFLKVSTRFLRASGDTVFPLSLIACRRAFFSSATASAAASCSSSSLSVGSLRRRAASARKGKERNKHEAWSNTVAALVHARDVSDDLVATSPASSCCLACKKDTWRDQRLPTTAAPLQHYIPWIQLSWHLLARL